MLFFFLKKIFSKPLLQSNLIAPNVHKELFSNCEILLENHLKFLKNLKERVNDWYAEQLIGDLFINEVMNVPYFIFIFLNIFLI